MNSELRDSEPIELASRIIEERGPREVSERYELPQYDSWEWKFADDKFLRVTDEFLRFGVDQRSRIESALDALKEPGTKRVILTSRDMTRECA